MILINTRDRIFELQGSKILLEGLECTDHEAGYQHHNGYCGSCRVKTLDGRMSCDDFPLVSVAPDEILLCCCRVYEDTKVDYRGRVSEPDLFDVGLFDEQDWSCCSK